MGEIYRATMTAGAGVEKVVAIKLARRSDVLPSSEVYAMFLEEARILMALSHANIVHVFDVGSFGDRVFIAMEYVRGRDLSRLGELPPPQVLTIIVEALKGLDY